MTQFLLFVFRRSLDKVTKFKYVATNKTGKAMENTRLIEVSKSLELKFYIITKQVKYYFVIQSTSKTPVFSQLEINTQSAEFDGRLLLYPGR